jgi:hypothetical protein
VNYKKVMSQYGLGPNGGIVTALNLFATRFDQVTIPVVVVVDKLNKFRSGVRLVSEESVGFGSHCARYAWSN